MPAVSSSATTVPQNPRDSPRSGTRAGDRTATPGLDAGRARDRDRGKRRSDRLKKQLDAARRVGFRQGAPFAKDWLQGRGGRPGRRPGPEYGRQACRRRPARVDQTQPHRRACGVSGPSSGVAPAPLVAYVLVARDGGDFVGSEPWSDDRSSSAPLVQRFSAVASSAAHRAGLPLEAHIQALAELLQHHLVVRSSMLVVGAAELRAAVGEDAQQRTCCSQNDSTRSLSRSAFERRECFLISGVSFWSCRSGCVGPEPGYPAPSAAEEVSDHIATTARQQCFGRGRPPTSIASNVQEPQ